MNKIALFSPAKKYLYAILSILLFYPYICLFSCHPVKKLPNQKRIHSSPIQALKPLSPEWGRLGVVG
jgi:hypothetical protein